MHSGELCEELFVTADTTGPVSPATSVRLAQLASSRDMAQRALGVLAATRLQAGSITSPSHRVQRCIDEADVQWGLARKVVPAGRASRGCPDRTTSSRRTSSTSDEEEKPGE